MQFPYVQCDTFGEKEMFKHLKASSYNGYAEMLFLSDHAITLTFIFLHASCLICNYIFIICFSFFFGGVGGC